VAQSKSGTFSVVAQKWQDMYLKFCTDTEEITHVICSGTEENQIYLNWHWKGMCIYHIVRRGHISSAQNISYFDAEQKRSHVCNLKFCNCVTFVKQVIQSGTQESKQVIWSCRAEVGHLSEKKLSEVAQQMLHKLSKLSEVAQQILHKLSKLSEFAQQMLHKLSKLSEVAQQMLYKLSKLSEVAQQMLHRLYKLSEVTQQMLHKLLYLQ
jgi:hypothetical protein